MNIHFVTFFFPPLKAPRSIQIAHLAGYFTKLANLTVYAVDESSGSRTDPSLLQMTTSTRAARVGASRLFKFIFLNKGYRIRKALLPDTYLPWVPRILRRLRKNFLDDDVVVTFGQPMSMHVTGLLLRICGRSFTWIAHFSDPWVDNPYNTYNRWTHLLNRILERLVFKSADHLIFTSEITRSSVVSKNPMLGSKSSVLTHSFDRSLFPEPLHQQSFKAKYTFRYLGNFYGKRTPAPLIEALKILKKADWSYKDICEFEVIGDDRGYGSESLIQFKKELPYIDSLRLMREADGLLLIDAPDSTGSPFFPSKLVDYLGSGRPILGLTSLGEAASILQRHGYSTIAPDASPVKIAEALKEFCERCINGAYAGHSKQIDIYEIAQVGAIFTRTIRETMERRTRSSQLKTNSPGLEQPAETLRE